MPVFLDTNILVYATLTDFDNTKHKIVNKLLKNLKGTNK